MTENGWELLAGGFAIPRRFQVYANVAVETSDRIEVQINVEVHDGRARARAVCVSSDRSLGVGSVTLKSIPVRGMMTHGIRSNLHRIDFDDQGGPSRVPIQDGDDKAEAVIKDLVGYIKPSKDEVGFYITSTSSEEDR